jgi:hypothetical protein
MTGDRTVVRGSWFEVRDGFVYVLLFLRVLRVLRVSAFDLLGAGDWGLYNSVESQRLITDTD